MQLDVLPSRSGGAAENMAIDFMLLQRYPREGAARFRHYGWHRPSFTFGYSQRIDWVRALLPAAEGPFDLCRRPTGGGLVDHRDDWTYALVIPRGHPMEDLRAMESYRLVHAALAAALRAQGVPAELNAPQDAGCDSGPRGPGVCFRQAEVHDVVRTGTAAKIAGAAQKRNRRGLLFQGSVWRPSAAEVSDWDRLGGDFAAGLAGMLDAGAECAPWPDFDGDELYGLTENYSSPEWIGLR